ATVAVAGEHNRKGASGDRGLHALSETPAEREYPCDLRTRRIYRTYDLDRNRTLQSSQRPRGARHIQQTGRPTTAVDALQTIVIWRGDQPQLLPGPALHHVIVKRVLRGPPVQPRLQTRAHGRLSPDRPRAQPQAVGVPSEPSLVVPAAEANAAAVASRWSKRMNRDSRVTGCSPWP